MDSYGDGPFPRTAPWLSVGLQSLLHLLHTLQKDSTLVVGIGSVSGLQEGIDAMFSAGLNETLSQIRAECKLLVFALLFENIGF